MGEHEEPWPKDRDFLLSNVDEVKWECVRQEVLVLSCRHAMSLTMRTAWKNGPETRSIGPKFPFVISLRYCRHLTSVEPCSVCNVLLTFIALLHAMFVSAGTLSPSCQRYTKSIHHRIFPTHRFLSKPRLQSYDGMPNAEVVYCLPFQLNG